MLKNTKENRAPPPPPSSSPSSPAAASSLKARAAAPPLRSPARGGGGGSAAADSKSPSSGSAGDVRALTSRVASNNAHEANGETVVAACELRTAMACSKHQEVEVLDSWEDIEGSDVLERKFRNLKPPSQNKCNGMTEQYKIILTGDDALRSQYVPPEPTVTILKRPTKQANGAGEMKVLQPKKTLRQRELEYAEARLRILGEAAASPERADDSNRYAGIHHNKGGGGGGTTAGGGRHSASPKASYQQQSPPPPYLQHDDNVIRLPRGPDGSKGFEQR